MDYFREARLWVLIPESEVVSKIYRQLSSDALLHLRSRTSQRHRTCLGEVGQIFNKLIAYVNGVDTEAFLTRFAVPGDMPTWRLKARLKAASDS